MEKPVILYHRTTSSILSCLNKGYLQDKVCTIKVILGWMGVKLIGEQGITETCASVKKHSFNYTDRF